MSLFLRRHSGPVIKAGSYRGVTTMEKRNTMTENCNTRRGWNFTTLSLYISEYAGRWPASESTTMIGVISRIAWSFLELSCVDCKATNNSSVSRCLFVYDLIITYPSTIRLCPLTRLIWVEDSRTTASPISSGFPCRPWRILKRLPYF